MSGPDDIKRLLTRLLYRGWSLERAEIQAPESWRRDRAALKSLAGLAEHWRRTADYITPEHCADELEAALSPSNTPDTQEGK